MLGNQIINTIIMFDDFVTRIYKGYKRRRLLRGLSVGDNSHISHDLYIKYPQNLTIGSYANVGIGVTIGAHSRVEILDHVTLSQDVIIETAGLTIKNGRSHKGKPIKIGNNVWLGARSIILGGVTIGDNVVVGAGTIVRQDLPPNSVFKGN